jgi:hypothetical protein
MRGSKEKHLAAAVTPPFGMLLAQAGDSEITDQSVAADVFDFACG